MKRTPFLSMASFNSCTTSLPTTLEHLKSLVHLIKKPFCKPFCSNGKPKVTARNLLLRISCSSFINFAS